MLFTTIKTKFAMLLRRPCAIKTAFWVALACAVLKPLPTLLQLVGCDGTSFLALLLRAYDAFSLSTVFTVATLLSLSVLWAVLSRMFPPTDRLVRYASSALALLLVVHALWIAVEAIFIPAPAAFAPKDAVAKMSMLVTVVLSDMQGLVQLAAALLLVVRYGGRLRQLGVLLAAQAALSCIVAVAAWALQSMHAGMFAALALSVVYLLCQTAISILVPVMLWRVVKG